MTKDFTVQVPASTSNLGSGFDTVSAALNLYLKVDVEMRPRGGIEWVEGWETSSQDNVLDLALRKTFAYLEANISGMRIGMENPIPLRRGLGSSAAAIIAGIKIAEHVCRTRLSRPQIFEIAYPLEGHPDNLAASLLGGWVVSWVDGDRMCVEKLDARLSCRFVLAVPEMTVSTREARSILPESYSRGDAVYNLQRCALLVHALHAGRKDLLREGTRDRLHQTYRSRLVPGMEKLLLEAASSVSPLTDSLLGMCISGSGSAVIGLADGDYDAIGRWMVNTFAQSGTPASYKVLDLDKTGAQVLA